MDKLYTVKTQARLSLLYMFNMCVGFMGIQFAWSIQMGQMSALYEKLGATAAQVALFWIAGPITGIIIQPIIGSLSDRTWTWLGRRRPYFLTGAILASLVLIAMPNSSALWVAASLLWIMDASINISMEPFRAFVADLAPSEQRGTAYSFQSFAIGIGSVASFGIGGLMILEWLPNQGEFGKMLVQFISPIVPTSLHALFYLGAIAMMITILWTVITTKEYPPVNLDEFRKLQKQHSGFKRWFIDTFESIKNMPEGMRKLALVHSFTWFAFFCIFLFFSVSVAHNIFKAQPNTPDYDRGIAWASYCYLAYNLVCFASSLLLGYLARFYKRKHIHMTALLLGGITLIALYFITDKFMALIAMGILGITWASVLSMPYAMLSGSVPEDKYGIYMGTFNIFICLPQIVCSLIMGYFVQYIGNGNYASALAIGGVSMILAGFLLKRFKE